MICINKNERGLGILEILVAVAVFVLGIASISHLYLSSHISSEYSSQKSRALLLAKEGNEAVRLIKNDDPEEVNELTDGGIELIDGTWNLKDSSDEIDEYERKITITEEEEDVWEVSTEVSWDPTRGEGGTVSSTEKITTWKESYSLDQFTCGDDITFTYNGSEVTYGTVETSDECWMDRNLGASRVAQSYDDSDSYGDLVQWGRPDDGHQDRNSSETSTLADSDHPGHSDFITNGDSPNDWRDPQNDDMWNEDGSGSNDGETCPEGWRVPSEDEWSSVSSNWEDREDAFNSDLKLPSAGYRDDNGYRNNVGKDGRYWSSSVDDKYARDLRFYSDSVSISGYFRVFGQPVRCLRDEN